MRPFAVATELNQRYFSDVIEKRFCNTVKTITNEEITIPNSAILTGNTINYSRFENPGLILSTIATIAYDVPWKKAHEMLIEAGLRCKDAAEPKPYVIQSALNEFYASYKIHVHINDAKLQLKVHRNFTGTFKMFATKME